MKLAIKICLWILAFISLIVDQNVFYPFTSGKALFIQTSLILVGILILINFFYSREYRDEIVAKATKNIKHPLVISVMAFIGIFIISTIFAVDKYAAFWGELSRAEGLAGIMFFFSFFVFTLLTFEKKDWLWFFKLSLFASLILLSKEFIEYFHGGIVRPGSFTGNPTFLAGYLLFSITSAFLVIGVPFETARVRSESLSQMGWRYLSVIVIILSVLGIFIAQTRGTILGLGLGVIAALIFFVVKGKDVNYKIFNLRKVAIILLTIGIIFSGVFTITRKNEIWQKVPGLSRLAGVNLSQDSTASRLFTYKSALLSINPNEGNLGKLLIGWGPDNFILASSKYYDSKQYMIETNWFDRSHNKFLDVLVMNGLLGLFAYLAIWILLFRYILKRKEFSLVSVGLLTFGVSYLVHLMFVFDEISTYIPFFSILAFTVYLSTGDPINESKNTLISLETKENREILVGSFLFVLGAFLFFIYFRSTLPGYNQMRNYTAIINTQNTITIEKEIDLVFTPITTAQMDIRRDFLGIVNRKYNRDLDQASLDLLEKAFTSAEDYIRYHNTDLGFVVSLADVYSKSGKKFNNHEYLKRGEGLLQNVLIYAPKRPDVNIKLAVNLIYQDRFMEAFDLFENVFVSSPTLISEDVGDFEFVYTSLVKFFYERRDKNNFIKTTDRLKSNNYVNSASLDVILEYLNTKGEWPRVNFE